MALEHFVDGGAWFFWAMMISMVIFWVAIIVAVFALIRWLAWPTGRPTAPTERDRALQILKERYAKGEISKEDYERMREELK